MSSIDKNLKFLHAYSAFAKDLNLSIGILELFKNLRSVNFQSNFWSYWSYYNFSAKIYTDFSDIITLPIKAKDKCFNFIKREILSIKEII